MVKSKQPDDGETFAMEEIRNPDDEFEGGLHRQEILDLKIEKLGTRITFVSILLPCFFIAVILFTYLDVKERILTIHDSGRDDVKIISEELEAKLNAMNVSMAKLKLSTETTVPDLLGTMEEFKTDIQKNVSDKAEKKEMENRLAALKQPIDKNSNSLKEIRHIIDRTNQETLSVISETEERLTDKLAEIQRETLSANQITQQKSLELEDTLKAGNERMDNLGGALLDFEDRIALLRKDLSLLKKQNDDIQKNTLNQENLDREITDLKIYFDKEIEALRLKIVEKTGRVVKAPLSALKAKPASEPNPTELPLPEVDQPDPFIEKDLSQ